MTPLSVPPYRLDDPSEVPSPALLVFPDLVRDNLQRMLDLAGSSDRLRPHVKTHKMPAIVKMAVDMGITKHKCATIAEAEMLAKAGAADVMVAYQPVGPTIGRLVRLIAAYPQSTFRTVVDDQGIASALSEAATKAGQSIPVSIDLDVGMGRTGIPIGLEAEALYEHIDDLPGLEPDGLHAYDGHNKQPDLDERRAASMAVAEQVAELRDRLLGRQLPVPRLVLGGTPNFPIYAELDWPGVECSPGTSVLQDGGYGSKFPDLTFTPAAVLLGRVISRPNSGRVCLDLGSKAVATDPPGDRLELLNCHGAKLGPQSEEHLVVETTEADRLPLGSPVLAIPKHICPTSALHQWAWVIEDGRVTDRWPVEARDRALSL